MAVNIPIWPGSSSFATGSTPFGYYDLDSDFQADADRSAQWCAKRLGYPIVDIELQDINFYACFEEAINEYSNQVNQFNIRENLLNIKGASTGSNLTQKQVASSMGGIISIAKDYGSEAGSGGRLTYYTGSFILTGSQQVYDLKDENVVSLEAGDLTSDSLEIKKMLHGSPAAIAQYFDPLVGTGLGSEQLRNSFGWGDYSPGVTFLLEPVYSDVLRLQAIEFNNMIRKSQYSFHIQNNRVRIFPIPTSLDSGTKIHFHYILNSERNTPSIGTGVVSDFSNAPYNRMAYSQINHVGKRWIQKYMLALVKEMLGAVRSKYASIPIPDSEITLDGADLRNEAASEKESLIAELRENMEATSRRALLQAQQEESDAVEGTLNKIPRPIYIG